MQQWLHSDNLRLIGVTATGGYGKSALVAKLSQTVAASFPQQIWANFSDAYPFAMWGRWLLDKLEKPAPEKPEDLLIAVCDCLQTERYLLVLDNLETLLQDDGQWQDQAYSDFLRRWFGSRSESKILMTSREQPTLPSNTLNQSKWLRLDGLSTDAGVALLQALEIPGSDTNLAEFVKGVDGHPLLLKLVAGLLKAEEGEEANISVLKQDIFEILGLHRDDPEASIAKILDASIQRLEPRLQTLLQDLSVYRLPFDCSAALAMSLQDLENLSPNLSSKRREALNSPPTQIGKGAEGLGFASSFPDEVKSQVEVELRQLAKRSLLQEKKQQGVWKFYFQPLIQSYLQNSSSPKAHHCAIAYYEQHRKPELLFTDKLDEVAEYLEIFHHHYELGEYVQAFSSVYYPANNHDDCDEFLRKNYYYPARLTLYERLYQEWKQPENSDELKFYSNLLKVYGDVLQFLDRREEALQRYETALSFYRDIGERLGEANILQEFGKLQENPQQALEYLQQAQNLYIQIGSIYNQSRNLLFIANAQLNMTDSDAAINSLTDAAELATTINYPPIQEYAQTRIAEINSTPTPTGGRKERFIQFIQQRWVKFAFCFLVGLIAFLLLRR